MDFQKYELVYTRIHHFLRIQNLRHNEYEEYILFLSFSIHVFFLQELNLDSHKQHVGIHQLLHHME